jgi:hypothetical protein
VHDFFIGRYFHGNISNVGKKESREIAQMWQKFIIVVCSMFTSAALAQTETDTDTNYQQRFAELARVCLHQQYPNHILHHVTGPGEMAEPRALHPAFYGCFDWHSSVHGHWLLVRLLHLNAPGLDREAIISQLDRSFTQSNITGEVAYFSGEDRNGYERPYGRAWFLQLMAELREWDSEEARVWAQNLMPLEKLIVAQTMLWLPNLNYAIRSGTHNQTGFGFGLMLDYARSAGLTEFENLLVRKIRQFYLKDTQCPLSYEPSGEDFLSPCLMEADLVRRVLPANEFSTWLSQFLPQIPTTGRDDWLEVGVVLDASDGKLVHLDGVNLSRAWALENIAATLPEGDKRISALNGSSKVHAAAGLASVTGEHYAGGHWLASFATYLITQRGL